MCNLYSDTTTQQAMRDLFDVESGLATNLEPRASIFPGHDGRVIRSTDGVRELVDMSWGFVFPQQGKAPRRVTNARDDKVRASPFWRNSFETRRCLTVASSFCEPKGRKPAVWHWFALEGDEERPAFAFAGLWRRWRGELKGELVDIETYAFLTTQPNALVATVHPDRMPVILAPEDHETWLSGSPEEAFALARPFPAERMRIVKRGPDKEDAAGV